MIESPEQGNFSETPQQRATKAVIGALGRGFQQSLDPRVPVDQRYFHLLVKQPENIIGIRIDTQMGVVTKGDLFLSNGDTWDRLGQGRTERRDRGLPHAVGRVTEKEELEIVFGPSFLFGLRFEDCVLYTTRGDVVFRRDREGKATLLVRENPKEQNIDRPTLEEYNMIEEIFIEAQRKLDAEERRLKEQEERNKKWKV